MLFLDLLYCILIKFILGQRSIHKYIWLSPVNENMKYKGTLRENLEARYYGLYRVADHFKAVSIGDELK